MPSFDISSEADMVALKNAVDIAGRHIGNRYDFKGSSARAELNEKDKIITIHGWRLGTYKRFLETRQNRCSRSRSVLKLSWPRRL